MATTNAVRLEHLYDIEERGEWNDADRAYISRVIRVLVAECVQLAENVIENEATADGYDIQWDARQALKNIDKVL